jgi:hypothetical protein
LDLVVNRYCFIAGLGAGGDAVAYQLRNKEIMKSFIKLACFILFAGGIILSAGFFDKDGRIEKIILDQFKVDLIGNVHGENVPVMGRLHLALGTVFKSCRFRYSAAAADERQSENRKKKASHRDLRKGTVCSIYRIKIGKLKEKMRDIGQEGKKFFIAVIVGHGSYNLCRKSAGTRK